MLDIYISVFIFITGLCIGSFLNVVALRALSMESIVFPSSKCMSCQKPLKWWHNIPVLSYLFLRGKCNYCKARISIQYPIVELITGLLFLAFYFKFGMTINTLFLMIFASMLIVISITDLREKCAFDMHSYILIVFGLIYNFFNFGNFYSGHFWIFNYSFAASCLGILEGILIIGLYMLVGYMLAKRQVIGSGDIFIAAGLGAIFGWKHLLTVIIASFLLQTLFSVIFFLRRLIKQKDIRTILILAGFLIYAAMISVINYSGVPLEPLIINSMLLLLLLWGLFACRTVLSLMQNKTDSDADAETSIPFGPAMAICAVVMMFLI